MVCNLLAATKLHYNQNINFKQEVQSGCMDRILSNILSKYYKLPGGKNV